MVVVTWLLWVRVIMPVVLMTIILMVMVRRSQEICGQVPLIPRRQLVSQINQTMHTTSSAAVRLTSGYSVERWEIFLILQRLRTVFHTVMSSAVVPVSQHRMSLSYHAINIVRHSSLVMSMRQTSSLVDIGVRQLTIPIR